MDAVAPSALALLSPRARERLVAALSAAFGVLLAAVAARLPLFLPAPEEVAAPVRVTFAVGSSPAEAAPPERIVPLLAEAPKAPAPAPPAPTPPVAKTPAPRTPSARPINPAPIPEQQVLPATAQLPPQPGLPLPPLPDSAPTLVIPEGVQPGGAAVVLALKLNHAGRVEDITLLVRSADPFFDLAVATQAMQTTFAAFDPPLQPGEARWVPLTVYKQAPAPALLP